MSAARPLWSVDGDSPAPWTVDESNYDGLAVKDANGGLIADVTDGHYSDDGEWIMADKCAHIAALIAAAPQLLADRKELVEALQSIAAVVNKTSGTDWDEIEEARTIARGALSRLESKERL